MNLTIILPSISNRELITRLEKQKREDDELYYFKSSSNSIKRGINRRLVNSNNSNIVIINSRDDMCLKWGFIDLFRQEGTVVSNLNNDGELSSKSSLKFNKSVVSQVPENIECRNMKSYIKNIYDSVEKEDIKQVDTKILRNRVQLNIDSTVSVAMVNYLREDRLIKTLKQLLSSTDNLKLNLVLQCQGEEQISQQKKNEILEVCSGFNRYEIIWTEGNVGTAQPRKTTTLKAYDQNPDYILILDSDMDIPFKTIERLILEHRNRPEYGVISCWCTPTYCKWKQTDDRLVSQNIDTGFHETEILGTGCALVKPQVFESCFFDDNLVIGFVDFHWCAEVKSCGWKLGILADKSFKLKNNNSHNTNEYKKERWKWDEIERSRRLFYDKWGLTITGSKWPKNKSFKDSQNVINFWGPNSKGPRGPRIQMENRKKYFPMYIQKYNFKWNSNFRRSKWNHITYIDVALKHSLSNISTGPNIDIDKELPQKIKDFLISVDSNWLKYYIIEKYNLNENQIFNIPVYVDEMFYNNIRNWETDNFTIGLCGYYEKNDIKNLQSLSKICDCLPKTNFQLLTSRNKNSFPKYLLNINNLDIINVDRNNIINVMSEWSGYLGMSKRERGPATIQEAKTLGIPTICSDHTGYSEFGPTIPLEIKPFKSHSNNDIDLIVDSIYDLYDNLDHYNEVAKIERHRFWNEEKHPKLISKKWEQFFDVCLENN